MTARRAAAVTAGLALAATLASCTAAPHHVAAAKTSPVSALVATRWWSNSAVAVGSRIDPAHPDAAAAKLHPSRTDYCGMLRQTLVAGHSILPGVTADDPALLDSTAAFVGELQQVAPAEVAGQWQVLGAAVLALVKSGGTTRVVGIDPAAVQRAVTAVSTDASTNCHLDLSKTH